LIITKEILEQVAELVSDKKGRNTVVLDLRDISVVTDYFLITTGGTPVPIRAIAEDLDEKLPELGFQLLRTEGRDTGHWVLMDFGDLVAHIMVPEDRDFYNLERLWGDAETIVGATAESL
jgi:ribosome-associated protein